MATKRAPSPRYSSNLPAPNVELQPDDLQLFWHLYCNRVMDAKSIYRLFPNRSQQKLSRRLNALRKEDAYISRLPQANTRAILRQGSDPLVYALSGGGAKALAAERKISIPLTRWKSKNLALTTNTIQHEIHASRFMAEVHRCAAMSGGDMSFHHSHEFMQIEPTNRGLPNVLRTQINGWKGHRVTEGTAPDRIFSIVAGGRKQFFFVEMDEGTETIAPGTSKISQASFWRSTSLLRKFAIYTSAFETKAHQACFDIPVFRVITVTTSRERIRNMQDSIKQHLPNARNGLFLFTHREAVEGSDKGSIPLVFQDTETGSVALI